MLTRWVLLGVFLLTGCAPNLEALAKDSATFCATVTTVYGTVKFARSNLLGGDVTCNDLTMHSTGGTQIPVTVVPMPKTP